MHRNRLRVLRADREITQLDLARKAGMDPMRYWRIEKGYLNPSKEERARIAQALKADVAELGFEAMAS